MTSSIVQTDVAVATPSASGSTHLDTNVHVPLVEDNESYAQSVAALLALEHFNTAIITTGTRALEVTKASRFSIAILDLNLPNFEGTTFVAALKYRALRIQIIVHTGHSTHGDAIAALNIVTFSYLEKSTDPAQLVVIVRRAANKATSAALHEIRERLQRIADNAPQFIAYVNPDMRY